MHRSGTSAVTGLLNLLGASAGAESDLIASDQANSKGYYENMELSDFQERLLRRLGGRWDKPPQLATGWQQSPRLLRDVGRGRRIVRNLYEPSTAWVWKDPRTCLLLPFWHRVFGRQPTIVVIYRNPLEVARSLAARNQFSKTRSLALWETYNRALLARAVPSLSVVSYESLVEHRSVVAREIHSFLSLGVFGFMSWTPPPPKCSWIRAFAIPSSRITPLPQTRTLLLDSASSLRNFAASRVPTNAFSSRV